jgi:hypothetical protein
MGLLDRLFGRRKAAAAGDGETVLNAGGQPVERRVTPDITTPFAPERFVGGKPVGEMTADERERLGIIDEARHTSSLGRR